MKPNDYYYQVSTEAMIPYIIFVGQITCREESFGDLKVGDRINTIGDTEDRMGMAVLNCMDSFKTSITYRGIFDEYMHGKDKPLVPCLMFELDPEEKPEGITEPCYIAYMILEHKEEGVTEMYLPDLRNNSFRIYRPKFGIL